MKMIHMSRFGTPVVDDGDLEEARARRGEWAPQAINGTVL